jgi:hypothetical protein
MSTATLEQMLDAPTYPAPTVERRQIRGLRMPALPSWPLLSQIGGGTAVLSGVFLLFGVAVTLIIGGAAAIALGALREGGKI